MTELQVIEFIGQYIRNWEEHSEKMSLNRIKKRVLKYQLR